MKHPRSGAETLVASERCFNAPKGHNVGSRRFQPTDQRTSKKKTSALKGLNQEVLKKGLCDPFRVEGIRAWTDSVG